MVVLARLITDRYGYCDGVQEGGGCALFRFFLYLFSDRAIYQTGYGAYMCGRVAVGTCAYPYLFVRKIIFFFLNYTDAYLDFSSLTNVI